MLKNKRLILMQGAAGSGKSRVAAALRESFATPYNQPELLCTDDERYVNGIYTFDPKTDWVNHAETRRKCELAMVRGAEVIIIDNTNILRKHAQPYIDLADKYEYDVQVIRVTGPRELHVEQNNMRELDRRIPDAVIDKMLDQMEDLF